MIRSLFLLLFLFLLLTLFFVFSILSSSLSLFYLYVISSLLFLSHLSCSLLIIFLLTFIPLSSSSVLSLPRRVTQWQSPPGGQYGDVRLSLLRQEGELSLEHTPVHSLMYSRLSLLPFLPSSFILFINSSFHFNSFPTLS